MKLLDDYNKLREELFAYFGYVEDWRVLPIDDRREYFWRVDQDARGGGEVVYAEHESLDDDDEEDYYSDEIYTQRHLPKWVYRGEAYTMVCVDTHTDGNQFLAIFDNAKERP